MIQTKNRRILVIDDNPSIHDDFRKVLCRTAENTASIEEKEAILFGQTSNGQACDSFEVDSAFQGNEAYEMIKQARADNTPYSMAFVDLRMPPGWDGIETIERVWNEDPELQFVICSAYSDHTADEILERLGMSDRVLLLKKPCDFAEIMLITTTVNCKWNLAANYASETFSEKCTSAD